LDANIHRRDPLARLWHTGGTIATLALTIATIYCLLRYGFDTPLIAGSSISTWLTMRWLTGIVGLVGIAGVMTYPLRKQVYRRRAGALRYWMLAHVYLGTIAGILILLHGGTKTGGLLTTALMISFDLVVLSGLVGILSYIIAPRIMTSIEGEPLLIEDLQADNSNSAMLSPHQSQAQAWKHAKLLPAKHVNASSPSVICCAITYVANR
jgi:hypothetical protein